MAMNVGMARDGEPVCEINTTPLIDVMLVLLVMLIITLPQQPHAVKLDTPVPCEACAETEDRPDPISVAVDLEGVITWNGAVVKPADLQPRLALEALKSAQPELHIQANRRAKYGMVAHVLAAAHRAGMKRMGIVAVG